MRLNITEKVFERLAKMNDEEYFSEIEKYEHPMIIDGVRYLFKENPLLYAKELTEKLYPNLVEERTMDIFYKKGMAADGKAPDMDLCRDEAKGSLIVKVLRTPGFKKMLLNDVEWIKSIVDMELFPEIEKEKDGDIER